MASVQPAEKVNEPTTSKNSCTESEIDTTVQIYDDDNQNSKKLIAIKSAGHDVYLTNVMFDPLSADKKDVTGKKKRLFLSSSSIHVQSDEKLNSASSSVSLKRSTSWPSDGVNTPLDLDTVQLEHALQSESDSSWLEQLTDSDDFKPNSISTLMKEMVVGLLETKPCEETTEFLNEFLPSLSEPLLLYLMDFGTRFPRRFQRLHVELTERHGHILRRLAQHKQSFTLKLTYKFGSWVPQAECVVCFRQNGGLSRICCSNIVCESCLNQYFLHMIEEEGRVQISCPACQKLCQREEITAHIPPATKDKFYRFLYANNDPNRKTCPQCSFVTERPKRPPTKKEKKYGLHITCEVCSLEWCFNCHSPSHTMSCKKFQAGDALFRQWTKQLMDGPHSSRNARRCPGCHVFIQRDEGCNHMHCSRCDSRFCYACGCRMRSAALIGGHENRFSVLGCKRSLHPNRPHLRRFVRGSLLSLGVTMSPIILTGACCVGLVYGTYLVSRLIFRQTKNGVVLRRLRRRLAAGEVEIEHPHFREQIVLRDIERDRRIHELLNVLGSLDGQPMTWGSDDVTDSVGDSNQIQEAEALSFRTSSSDYLTHL